MRLHLSAWSIHCELLRRCVTNHTHAVVRGDHIVIAEIVVSLVHVSHMLMHALGNGPCGKMYRGNCRQCQPKIPTIPGFVTSIKTLSQRFVRHTHTHTYGHGPKYYCLWCARESTRECCGCRMFGLRAEIQSGKPIVMSTDNYTNSIIHSTHTRIQFEWLRSLLLPCLTPANSDRVQNE